MSPRLFLSITVLLCAVIAAAQPVTASSDQKVDPMDWKTPTALPPLRQQISGDEYTKQFQAALDAVNKDQLASGTPDPKTPMSLAQAYWRSNLRDQTWDWQILVAAMAWPQNPD